MKNKYFSNIVGSFSINFSVSQTQTLHIAFVIKRNTHRKKGMLTWVLKYNACEQSCIIKPKQRLPNY